MTTRDPVPGLRANRAAFVQQLIQVFFVGLTIGLQRTVIPALAETEFGLVRGSMTALFAFVVSFGLVKAAMNLVSGRLSERVGRRPVLIWGWIAAIPIPVMILLAPSWGWIVAANVLLGINQGFCWSMTVTAKIDIALPGERGLATGVNEAAGYGGVALAGIATGWLAGAMDPRTALAVFGGAVIVLALAAALAAFEETLPLARAAARAAPASTPPPGLPAAFARVTWRDRDLAALSQAGSVEKFVDAAMWVILPVHLTAQGASLLQVGQVAGTYGLVWGLGQLLTGPLSDRIGRKPPILAGFLLCAAGIAAFPLAQGMAAWTLAAAVAGAGIALLYPTLIAAVGDVAPPAWRGTALGVYRFWRDLGYALGALAMGLAVDLTGAVAAGFWLTAGAMVASALWLALALREPRPAAVRGRGQMP